MSIVHSCLLVDTYMCFVKLVGRPVVLKYYWAGRNASKTGQKCRFHSPIVCEKIKPNPQFACLQFGYQPEITVGFESEQVGSLKLVAVFFVIFSLTGTFCMLNWFFIYIQLERATFSPYRGFNFPKFELNYWLMKTIPTRIFGTQNSKWMLSNFIFQHSSFCLIENTLEI